MDELLSTRTKLRSKSTKLCNELRSYREGDRKHLDPDLLALKLHHVQKVQSELHSTQAELDKLGQADDTGHMQTMEDEVFLGSRLLTRLERAEEAKEKAEPPTASGNTDIKSSISVKIPTFHGDVMKWSEFWELFEISVHNNPGFADVQRFVVLKSHLAGVALKCVQGIPVSGGGYAEAVSALKERFDRDDIRRENLMKDMLSMPAVRQNDLKAMRSLIDHLMTHTRALGTLGVGSDSFSSLMLPVVKDKIPEGWRLEWARRESSDFSEFLEFLQHEMRVRESARGNTVSTASSETPISTQSAVSSLHAQRMARPGHRPSAPVCGCCRHGSHRLDQCTKFQQLSVEARWKSARALKSCYQCLRLGHLAAACRDNSCTICGKRHHSLLHYASAAPKGNCDERRGLSPEAPSFSPSQTTARRIQSDADARNAVHQGTHRYNATSISGKETFFQTALVNVEGPGGQKKARLLIDGGSDASYIRTSLAKELELSVTGTGMFACVGFQEKREEAKSYEQVQVTLRSRFGGDPVTLKMWSTESLCSPLPATSPPTGPSGLPDWMADDFDGGEVDLLIGIDYLYHVVLWEQIEIGEGLRAIETIFGYVLHGYKGDCSQNWPRHQTFHCCQVERMWSLDVIGIGQEDTRETDGTLPQPRLIDSEGRYEMGLLWRSEERPTSNHGLTKTRTARMSDRLSGEKARLYDEQIQTMKRDGVVELSVANSNTLLGPEDEGAGLSPTGQSGAVNPEQGPKPPPSVPGEFFLPHHGISRNGKLRIVFDGSAKDGKGQSLNDYLSPGENLLAKLPSVLLGFRSGQVGCQADIQAAFHQVVVREEDRRYLQFFWHDSCLRFARVPFGLTCSPYMLLKTVEAHLSRYLDRDLELCQLISKGSYMDDLCLPFRNREDAENGISRAKDIFSDASMNLHKVRITGDPSPPASVLGLVWDTQTDRLAVTVPECSCPTTRRELLSTIAKVFDPLGLLTPWLIGGKILFQRTWKEIPDSNWNDPLGTDIQTAVRTWWKDSQGREVHFDRPLTSGGKISEAEFHVFCDASEKAYCAVVYAVLDHQPRLVMAKGRLAPLDPNLTIPRLELMAAVIGVRLMEFIRTSLELENPPVTYWSDSIDVLCWIRSEKPRKVFVQNRLSAIRKLSPPGRWRYIRGAENPADLGTRGISLSVTSDCSHWWNGPCFLSEEIQSSVQEASVSFSPEALREDKPEPRSQRMTPAKVTLRAEREDTRLFDITECSSLKIAINKTAWVSRFAYNARRAHAERKTGPLSVEERCEALQFWIRDAQNRAYDSELKALRSAALLPKASPLVKLRPRLDDDGVMCAVPRTNEQPLPILPEFAHITSLIIDDAHKRCFHQGTRATLAVLSAEYLVRRRSVLRVVNTCRRCRRYRGSSYRAADGGLPSFRIEPCRAFAKVGLDFFGPLITGAGTKSWVLLITCATSRAVHLELVKSQHTDDVKLALRRFFAIRGAPVLIYSDNAKTFHALLTHIPRTVTWRFIPEAAPWWGGFWERMVGVTKQCLKITLHLCHLSFDELAATLYELAFHLNMRPLTLVDGELLTPAHLLFGVTSIRGVLYPTGIYCDSLTRAWRHQRRVSEHLLRRWTTEYVSALRTWSVSPRGRPADVPKLGDIVLVHGEGPRGRWPLARVTGLILGADGHPRAAHIEMRGRRTRRPLSKLYHLEANTSDT